MTYDFSGSYFPAILDPVLRVAFPAYLGLTYSPGSLAVQTSTDLSAEDQTLMAAHVADNASGGALVAARQGKEVQLRAQVEGYLFRFYSPGTQSTMHGLMTQAIVLNYPERKGKIVEIFSWVETVLGYFDSVYIQVAASGTIEAVAALALNLDQFTASRPLYTRSELQALQA